MQTTNWTLLIIIVLFFSLVSLTGGIMLGKAMESSDIEKAIANGEDAEALTVYKENIVDDVKKKLVEKGALSSALRDSGPYFGNQNNFNFKGKINNINLNRQELTLEVEPSSIDEVLSDDVILKVIKYTDITEVTTRGDELPKIEYEETTTFGGQVVKSPKIIRNDIKLNIADLSLDDVLRVYGDIENETFLADKIKKIN